MDRLYLVTYGAFGGRYLIWATSRQSAETKFINYYNQKYKKHYGEKATINFKKLHIEAIRQPKSGIKEL